nr:MAG TPA: capsid scaffolding protein [Caudoviricetes sp.]
MNEETQTVETVEEQVVPAEPTNEHQPQDEKKYTDADVDEIINKKFAKWKSEQEAKENEAKKLAKMNADEKQKYQLDQREQELANREQVLARKELTAEAKAMLSERGLPVELVAVVDLSNAEAVTESVASIQKTWEDAVQKGVSDRMKGSAPIKTAPQNNNELTKAQFYRMTHAEKANLKQTNPELYDSFLN